MDAYMGGLAHGGRFPVEPVRQCSQGDIAACGLRSFSGYEWMVRGHGNVQVRNQQGLERVRAVVVVRTAPSGVEGCSEWSGVLRWWEGPVLERGKGE